VFESVANGCHVLARRLLIGRQAYQGPTLIEPNLEFSPPLSYSKLCLRFWIFFVEEVEEVLLALFGVVAFHPGCHALVSVVLGRGLLQTEHNMTDSKFEFVGITVRKTIYLCKWVFFCIGCKIFAAGVLG